jgi:glycosyltransferase involved in cell wall biosynthesis
MKVAVYLPENTPYSMKHCAWNIMRILQEKYNIEFVTFKTLQELPVEHTDIYWDPRCGGGIAPPLAFRKTKKPLVLTVHGMAMFTLPLDTFYFSARQQVSGQLKRWKERLKWRLMQAHITHVMTVSNYTKSELVKSVDFPADKITAVWNGVDHDKFKPAAKKNNVAPYFFTVISYQKKKNFERLLEAYQQLDEQIRPRLVAIVKPYELKEQIKGVEIINTNISEEQLVDFYQQALGLVFVSLHEGFGLPIAEAMACGVPVITSDATSCKEIAGDAAILVNPESVSDIKEAMYQLSSNASLRQDLMEKGLERAGNFNWEFSAEQFYKILKSTQTAV